MVGDEDQLIYSFRSSDIAILKDFESTANEIIILNENYRCNKEIIKAANKLISYNQNRLDKNLISNIEATKKVIYNDFEDQIEEAKYVSRKIKQFQLLGEDLSSIAVLYRNNNQSYAIEKALTEDKIPYQIFGGMAFFEYKDIRTIIYVYRLLFNPRNMIAFEEIYNKLINQFEWYEMKKVIDDYHKQSDDIITYLSKQTDPRLKDLGDRYLKLKELMNVFEPVDFFMQVLKHLNYSKYLKESNAQKPEYKRLMMLRDMLTGLSKNEVEDFFNNLMLENKNEKKINGVSIMTIHKSKGLEFNTVFVIGCNEGIIPGYSTRINDIEEDRRVFYVAMTRAKQNLFLLDSKVHYVNGRTLKLKPSQFLYESNIRSRSLE